MHLCIHHEALDVCDEFYSRCRQKVFMVLDNPSSCRLGRYTSMAVLATISVAAISFVVESLPRYRIPVRVAWPW